MIAAILGALNPIEHITKAIVQARIASTTAATDQERIAADERVKTLEQRRAVLVAEASVTKANVLVRSFIALPVGILIWKVLVWDKALGQWTGGRTDALDPNLWNVVTMVLGFYFLYEGAVGVARVIKR